MLGFVGVVVACASASRADISRAFSSSSELVLSRAQSGNSFSGRNGVSVPVVPIHAAPPHQRDRHASAANVVHYALYLNDPIALIAEQPKSKETQKENLIFSKCCSYAYEQLWFAPYCIKGLPLKTTIICEFFIPDSTSQNALKFSNSRSSETSRKNILSVSVQQQQQQQQPNDEKQKMRSRRMDYNYSASTCSSSHCLLETEFKIYNL
uniref:Uncharacterized protein n=1 Tax=Glossina pallidipes TaxID=7398 RepID=A0A1A9Z4W6_GLOPL